MKFERGWWEGERGPFWYVLLILLGLGKLLSFLFPEGLTFSEIGFVTVGLGTIILIAYLLNKLFNKKL